MKINTNLLLQVRDCILARPEHFDMGSYVDRTDCGTTACIAGWAVSLSRGRTPMSDTYLIDSLSTGWSAQALLRLSARQAYTLFHVNGWPIYWNLAYDSADGDARAAVAAGFINHFIATEGREGTSWHAFSVARAHP